MIRWSCKAVLPRYQDRRCDDWHDVLRQLSILATAWLGGCRVSNLLYPLSDDDVRQIALLVETLDQSSLDFLQLDIGDIKLTIGKGEVPVVATSASAARSAPSAQPPSSPETPATVSAVAPEPIQEVQTAAPAEDDGTLAIVAPIMGRFSPSLIQHLLHSYRSAAR